MNELIKLNGRVVGASVVETVNARELHAFLEVGKDFSTWIKDRIEQYGFAENQDFAIFPEIGEKSSRGRRAVDYAITLDMAKELAMVERNAKGKQARQYFIECERRARALADPMQVLTDPAALRTALLTYSEKVIALEQQVAEQAPKAKALERIAEADGSLCITSAAKHLQLRPKDLFAWLKEHAWIYHRAGGSGWLAYQNRLQQGVLEHKITTVTRGDGSEKVVEQVRVTPKGLTRLAKQIGSPGGLPDMLD